MQTIARASAEPLTDPSVAARRASLSLSRERALTRDESLAVVTRNSVCRVHHTLGDGALRTSRVRYVPEGRVLYIPAWTATNVWNVAGWPALKCHVSEVEWRSGWRYVWLGGPATPLQPTGPAHERDAWRDGVAALRRLIPNLAPTDDLALANFGILRLDVESWEGVIVSWGEAIDAPAPGVTKP